MRIWDWVKREWIYCRGVIGYVRRRLGERSTWMGFFGLMAPVAGMPSPWCWLALVMGVAGVLIPDAKAAS